MDPGRTPTPEERLRRQRHLVQKLIDDAKHIGEILSQERQKLKDLEISHAGDLDSKIKHLRISGEPPDLEDIPMRSPTILPSTHTEIEGDNSVQLDYAPGDTRFNPYFMAKYGAPSTVDAQKRPLAVIFDIDVQRFVDQELESGDDLWDLVIVSGLPSTGLSWSLSPPVATTVGEYLCRRWPDISELMRLIIERLSGNPTHNKPVAEQQLATSVLVDPKSRDPGSKVMVPAKVEKTALPSSGRDVATGIKDKQKKGWVVTTGNQSKASTETNTSKNHDKSARFEPCWELRPAEDLIGLTVSAFRDTEAKNPAELLMFMSGSTPQQADLVEALAWLSAVLCNVPKQKFPNACSVQLREIIRSDHTAFQVSLSHQGMHLRATGDCWASLFPSTPCTVGFPVCAPSDRATGLDLSFELMCTLCGIEYEVVENGGVVLYGQQSVVYPVFKENNCVQWHFIPCQDTSIINHAQWGQRLLCDDLDLLRNMRRHLLGLWNQPEITLGSDCIDFSNPKLKYSGAKPMNNLLTKDNITVGGAISLPKVLTLNGAYNFKIAKTRRNQYMKNFEGNLHRMINSPVILYNPVEKRAWMVSFVSVVLHLARYRAWLQRELGFRIPGCVAAADGGRAAFGSIRENYRSPLKIPMENEELSEDERNLTIRDYIEDVLASLDVARRESSRTRGIFRERILGFEFADIAKMKENMTMRRCNFDAVATGWAPLLDAVSIVLFYDGLSDPIVPSTQSQRAWERAGHCGRTMWRRVPEGYNILAASLPCLDYMSEHLNTGPNIRRLSYDYCWHSPCPRLFDLCARTRHHICNRLQELRPDGPDVVGPILSDENRKNAAVAFRFSTDMQTIQDHNPPGVGYTPTPPGTPSRIPPTPLASLPPAIRDGASLEPPLDTVGLDRTDTRREARLADEPVAAARTERVRIEPGGQSHTEMRHPGASRRSRGPAREQRRVERRRTARNGNIGQKSRSGGFWLFGK
ncbi:uncharacterized protein Z518_09299 [Rhinocladiella mackenziei CBS 650.93]|uniref:Uncharacterized protein n=1 Tax=Rhinocladiella mackenziei CBS 650.93 TaxID=1442369 RepID=A0A0D2GTD5_9EURO|nr:uncharacterized protein Z518_09299 [Rhinocladiella mackenziei CBS 650.93]KIX01573.1 hypothetical protein Z518_09299 [Rhinocladiella mackenziei CBS 650.93]